jgi:V/A-type H+-transporting ATPase subunit E
MSVQLQELIERIKREGVQEAEARAEDIKKKAEDEASRIIDSAKREAESRLEKAKQEIEQFDVASKEAIKQAGRDLVLKVESEITGLFDGILKQEIKEALDQQVLKDSVLALIQAWGKQKSEDYEIILSEKNRDAVWDYLVKHLKEDVRKGVEIKPTNQIDSGFRVAEKDGAAYFDFSDRGLADFLMEYLNPRVAEILKGKET